MSEAIIYTVRLKDSQPGLYLHDHRMNRFGGISGVKVYRAKGPATAYINKAKKNPNSYCRYTHTNGRYDQFYPYRADGLELEVVAFKLVEIVVDAV